MPAISPAEGVVAVTGASGYIGSWIVRDLMQQGYRVRACVRDVSRVDKIEHLQAFNDDPSLRGSVELAEADLNQPGSYDAPFSGCAGVIHAGAAVGFNKETPQEVYDGCFTENEHVLASVEKSGSVKRFIFTSSFAAVGHPRPQGYVFTEKDWCDDNRQDQANWSDETIPKNRDIAYAMAKARTEKMIYAAAEKNGGFEALAILPLHVIGPLMCVNHDQGWSWQNCIRFMMSGKPYNKSRGGRMLWNLVDVRDVARAHRLAAETTIGSNGSRYILSAEDRSGELRTHELQARLRQLFPTLENVGGEEMDGDQPAKPTYDSPRSYCLLAKEELGLEPISVDQSIKDTGDSYFRLGLINR